MSELASGSASQDAIQWAIRPLKLIFWGALLCLFDVTLTQQSTSGQGFRFDILNDAAGALLIAIGVYRLAALSFPPRYQLGMKFVQCMAVLAVVNAIGDHFITPIPVGLSVVLQLVGLATLVAIIVFCRAMRGLCEDARLVRAARSWRVTSRLFVGIYLVPLGLFYLVAIGALVSGSSFHVDLGPAALLLLPLFFAPLIHFLVSTSRMRRCLEGEFGGPPGGMGRPPRPRVSFPVLLKGLSLGIVSGLGLIVTLMLFAGPSEDVETLTFSHNHMIDLDDIFAVEDSGNVRPRFAMREIHTLSVNDEVGFIVFPVFCSPHSTRQTYVNRTRNGSYQTNGIWHLHEYWTCFYNHSIPSDDISAGIMKFDLDRWSLADGQVFLIKQESFDSSSLDVLQIRAPMTGGDPGEILRKIVASNEEVRQFIATAWAESLRSRDPDYRNEAAVCLYRYDLGSELETGLLLDQLKTGENWPRLLAASELWDRQRHKKAIPVLLDLLRHPKRGGLDDWRVVQKQAARELGQIAPQTVEVLAALWNAAGSSNERLSMAAAEALQRIAP